LLKRSPLVVLCHDGPWNRDQPGYNREAQALAWMGFTVLQVNYRGSSGFGLKHLNALRESYDTAAIDDILTAMDRLNRDIFDRRLVAIMGKGYGGLLALRALQLHPARFRCAVTIDTPTDLGAWIGSNDVIGEIPVLSSEMTDGAVFGARRGGTSTTTEVRRAYFGDDSARWKAVSPLTHAHLTKGPVMLIEGPEFHGGRGDTFAGIVRKNGVPAEYVALNGDEAADLPKAKAALYGRIYGFLNESIYNFWVKEGELKEVESATRPQAPDAPEK
jgi:pimeloyl-ACP methyl ester carboxylesterase